MCTFLNYKIIRINVLKVFIPSTVEWFGYQYFWYGNLDKIVHYSPIWGDIHLFRILTVKPKGGTSQACLTWQYCKFMTQGDNS